IIAHSMPMCSQISLLASSFFFQRPRRPPTPTLFPYTTLFRSHGERELRFLEMAGQRREGARCDIGPGVYYSLFGRGRLVRAGCRSEEHTSELQSRENLVCRLLLEKKN